MAIDYAQQVPLAARQWLLVVALATLIPWLTTLPIWLLVVAGFALVIRYFVLRQRLAPPRRLFKLAMVVTVLAGVSVSFASFSLESAITLLVAMYLLKFTEAYERASIKVLVLTGIYIACARLLFAQGMLSTAFVVLLIALNLFVLALSQRHGEGSGVRRQTWLGMLVALPFAIALFSFFPRVGPLWQVPLASQSFTGLSEDIALGSMAELAQKDELAFRVRFFGEPPPRPYYWRAMTLSHFDESGTWQRLAPGIRWPQVPAARVEPDVRYEIISNPTGQNMLFTLGVPVAPLPARSQLRQDDRLVRSEPLTQTLAYQVNSVLTRPASTLQAGAEAYLMRTSEHPRLTELVASWPAQSIEQRLATIEDYFRQRPFFYTLSPPKYPASGEALDAFVFDQRLGFCSHYASAVTMMLRESGIPARIVGGYLGGRWSQAGEYLTVSQLDAHAWVEYHDGERWQEIDPTGWVAPERILSSPSEFLSGADELIEQGLLSTNGSGVFARIGWQLDALQYFWQRSVVNYDDEDRQALLREWFGRADIWSMLWVFVPIISLPLWLYLGWQGWRYWRRPALEKYMAKLEKRHGKRAPGQTPLQYCRSHGLDEAPVLALYQKGLAGD